MKRVDIPDQLPLSIIIGDINGLKQINDSFGTLEGDKIIVATAKLLNSCCRKDDILARTGGDEFSILLPKTSLQAAIVRMKVIHEACEQYNKNTNGGAYHINLSLGADTKETVDVQFIMVYSSAENYLNQRKLLVKNSSYNAIISSIKATMLEKSHETEEHAERIAQLSKKSGTDIPLISRIIAVVDSYDTMTEDRVYRKAMTHEEAIVEIRKCGGSQFDPRIAQIFIESLNSDDVSEGMYQ